MKLAVLGLCFLPFSFLSFGLDSHTSLIKSKTSHSDAGYVHHGRMILFARRGLYEQHRIQEPQKSRIVSLPQNNVPGHKVVPKPMTPKCSQLGQSCVPLCGCCDLCATCHCRFFNAICFCRKTKSRCGKKAQDSGKATKSQRHNPRHTPGQ